MKPVMEIDTAGFQETLRKYIAVTSKTIPQALNQKMFYISRGASRLTPKTSREVIERELGVVGYKTVFNKRGSISLSKTKKRSSINALLKGGALVYRIINARLARIGQPGITGDRMKEAAASLLAKRFRSVGTLKAGWLGAIRTLGASVGEPSRVDGASSIIKGRSTAKVAKEGFSPEVSIQYVTNSFTKEHRAYIDARVNSALSQAFSDEQASMEKYILNKMQTAIDGVPVSTKTTPKKLTKEEGVAFINKMLKP